MKLSRTPLILPAPIEAYFAADQLDGEAVSECFTQTAVVKDEESAYHGRAEIKQWKTESSKKYEYTSEPHTCEEKEDGTVVVTSTLTGNFPGSPVDLRFIFKLVVDKIESLEVGD